MRPYLRRHLSTFAFAAVFLVLCLATANATNPQSPKIVAVGDVHGAFDELTSVLRAAGVVDESLSWQAGDTTLVQTGDFMDRGADVRRVMDLFMRLQSEAEAAGGRVIVLAGDHELLNLIGELRDTTPELVAKFAAEDRDEVLAEAVKEYEKVYFEKASAWGRASRPQREDIKEEWRNDQPEGRIEYLRAMGRDGLYGSWLRTLPAMVMVDGILFMHAGMAPEMAAWNVDTVNQRVADELAYLDNARAYLQDRDLLTSFPDLSETIQAVVTDAGGIDWFEAPNEFPARPPALPAGEYGEVDGEERAAALLRMNGWFALAPRGPLWYRGLAQSPDPALAAQLPGVLAATGARAIVAGHTPQTEGIKARLDGQVYLIDTGMLTSVYEGRPSALVIEGDAATAVYADGSREPLAPVAAAVAPVTQ